jgi:hypothetical protein
MKDLYYKQCKLTKKEGQSTYTQIAWIPEKFAVLNKVLKIKEVNEWDNGWVVISAGERKLEEYLPNSHRDIKNHRKNTGDSLPK